MPIEINTIPNPTCYTDPTFGLRRIQDISVGDTGVDLETIGSNWTIHLNHTDTESIVEHTPEQKARYLLGVLELTHLWRMDLPEKHGFDGLPTLPDTVEVVTDKDLAKYLRGTIGKHFCKKESLRHWKGKTKLVINMQELARDTKAVDKAIDKAIKTLDNS